MRSFYFGRGSSNCIAVELPDGPNCRVFIGNAKTLELNSKALFARDELYRLSDFFRALWQVEGHRYQVAIMDDPHDEVFVHDLDFSQTENSPAT